MCAYFTRPPVYKDVNNATHSHELWRANRSASADSATCGDAFIHLSATGFSGRWLTLIESYRMKETNLVEVAKHSKEDFASIGFLDQERASTTH